MDIYSSDDVTFLPCAFNYLLATVGMAVYKKCKANIDKTVSRELFRHLAQ